MLSELSENILTLRLKDVIILLVLIDFCLIQVLTPALLQDFARFFQMKLCVLSIISLATSYWWQLNLTDTKPLPSES
jgi:hypothetical protein